MRLVLIVLIFVFAQTAVSSQTLAEWFRVHTFDDKSVVELNTNYVMFSTAYSGRVRFRWIYENPQNLDRDAKIQFRSVLQEIAFDCRNTRFSRYETKWFDVEGKLLKTESLPALDQWQKVSGVAGKLYNQACCLIELRKREPAQDEL